MLIIPAIDLQAGTCVRLKQGQFDKVTAFEVSPLERAGYFAELGAKRLHLVDLDGARMGTMQQLPLIQSLCSLPIKVQAGGGIRSLDSAKQAIAAGISSLVIGSIAVTDPVLTKEIIQAIGADNIILALDVHMDKQVPRPATHGWQKPSSQNLWEVIADYQQVGIQQVLCTDIACDGMMSGPNFSLYKEAVERFPTVAWQASGGIRHLDDVARLDSLGVAASILGLTLYQGAFNLSQCLEEYA